MTFGRCRGPAAEYWYFYLNYYNRCEHCCLYCFGCNWKKVGPVRITDRPENLPHYFEKWGGIDKIPEVVLCNNTDAYQPAEVEIEATRGVLDWWLDNCPQVPVCILTKSPLVLRDIDLLSVLKVRAGFTITTVNQTLAGIWEPHAPPVHKRLVALHTLHECGIPTWVSCEPCLDESTPFRLLEVDYIDKLYVGALSKRWFIAPQMRGKEPEIDYQALAARLRDLQDERVVLKKSMTLAPSKEGSG